MHADGVVVAVGGVAAGGLVLQSEIEQLKAKNEELALQVVNLQEELKRSKAPASGGRRGMASSDR